MLGMTKMTAIPKGASSCRRTSVRSSMEDLAALYTPPIGTASLLLILLMLMVRHEPRVRTTGATSEQR